VWCRPNKSNDFIESSVVNEGKEDLKRLAVKSFQVFFIHTGLNNTEEEENGNRGPGELYFQAMNFDLSGHSPFSIYFI